MVRFVTYRDRSAALPIVVPAGSSHRQHTPARPSDALVRRPLAIREEPFLRSGGATESPGRGSDPAGTAYKKRLPSFNDSILGKDVALFRRQPELPAIAITRGHPAVETVWKDVHHNWLANIVFDTCGVVVTPPAGHVTTSSPA